LGEYEMSRRLLLETAEDVKKLALRLSKSDRVRCFDEGEDGKGSWELAIHFSDLEESFSEFLNTHLPKLMAEDTQEPQEIEDILFDIGLEFKHILWHLKEARYFRDTLMDFKLCKKDRRGFLYFGCPECDRHLQCDPITGKIKIRKGILGFLFGRYS
jgi:hypothetical protein